MDPRFVSWDYIHHQFSQKALRIAWEEIRLKYQHKKDDILSSIELISLKNELPSKRWTLEAFALNRFFHSKMYNVVHKHHHDDDRTEFSAETQWIKDMTAIQPNTNVVPAFHSSSEPSSASSTSAVDVIIIDQDLERMQARHQRRSHLLYQSPVLPQYSLSFVKQLLSVVRHLPNDRDVETSMMLFQGDSDFNLQAIDCGTFITQYMVHDHFTRFKVKKDSHSINQS